MGLKYPNTIIPQTYYKERIDISSVLKLKRPCIVRSSSKPFEETFNVETETLREDVILPKDVIELSMNLMGGRLKIRHLNYRVKKAAMNIWSKPEKPTIRKYQGLYEKTKIAIPIYFYLKDIHDKPFPYYRTNDTEAKKLIQFLNITPRVVNDNVEFEGKCFVKHTPNKLNYWHVEILLKGNDGNEIKAGKSAWIKSAAGESYKNIIAVSAKSFVRKYSIIPRTEYLEVA